MAGGKRQGGLGELHPSLERPAESPVPRGRFERGVFWGPFSDRCFMFHDVCWSNALAGDTSYVARHKLCGSDNPSMTHVRESLRFYHRYHLHEPRSSARARWLP